MYCVTTIISKGTIISLSRKVCLKKLCVIFQLEMHCNRPMDVSIWWQQYFPNGRSNEVYQYKVMVKRNRKTDKTIWGRDYQGATNRAHNIQMYASKFTVCVNFVEAVQRFIWQNNILLFYFLKLTKLPSLVEIFFCSSQSFGLNI